MNVEALPCHPPRRRGSRKGGAFLDSRLRGNDKRQQPSVEPSLRKRPLATFVLVDMRGLWYYGRRFSVTQGRGPL